MQGTKTGKSWSTILRGVRLDAVAELCDLAGVIHLHSLYSDGTGTVSYYGPLEPGRYKLEFGYRVSGKGPLRTERDPGTWLGNVLTAHVLVDVLSP